MRQTFLSLMAGFFLAAMSTPAWANIPAQPGALNYVEGRASIGSLQLNSKSVGKAQLEPGQSLVTSQGKAEILLTPGVFVRLGPQSSLRMISPDLTGTTVELQRGRAMVEVDQIYPENNIQVRLDHVSTRLLKTGLYDFDANAHQVRVFEGQAVVTTDDRQIKLKGGREFTSGGRLKAAKFDKKAYEGELYQWSSLRSDYLAQASNQMAYNFVGPGGYYGPGWFGAGWYWDPWFDYYTFLPGDGFLYSPFGWGWGFASPFWAFNYGGFGYGGYGRGFRGGFGGLRGGGFRGGGLSAHGFAGGRGGFSGGGFHGGGGGFGGHGGGGHGR